jgi:hypothetical protein
MSKYSESRKLDAKYEVVSHLKNLILIETAIEKTKQDLALKADFNMFDAFRMFDKYNIGHLYRSDFEDGLNKLGVFAPRT